MKAVKEYSFNGLAGCVVQRKSRQTGAMVGLYYGPQSFEVGFGEELWFTVCEEHGACVGHATQQAARSWMPEPSMWCEECQKAGHAE